MDIELLFDYLCPLTAVQSALRMKPGTQRAHKSSAGDSTSETVGTRPDKNTKRLVLFDFDGTITTKDTLVEFAVFYRGRQHYLLGLVVLAPIMMLYVTKLIANWKAKQYFLSRFFKGEKIAVFNARCSDFARSVLPSLIRPEAMSAIKEYLDQKATVAVVSASAENWVRPWCDQLGLVCVATKLEVKDGLITGKLEGRNCYGDEKACRVREWFNLSDFNEVIAYGDSPGDKEMLDLADRKYYKPFR